MDEREGAQIDREAVVRALAGLKDPPDREELSRLDDEGLCEVLFDRFDDFIPRRFFQLASRLRQAELTKKAADVLERLYLFLDPLRVGRHALVKLVTDQMAGRRMHPFAAWEDRALEESAEMLRHDPGDALMAFPGDDGLEKSILQELARFFNGMDYPYRRLVWMTCVQHKSVAEVARETGLPYERVEWLLSEIERDIEDIIRSQMRRRRRYRAADGESAGPAGESEGKDGREADEDGEEMEHGS